MSAWRGAVLGGWLAPSVIACVGDGRGELTAPVRAEGSATGGWTDDDGVAFAIDEGRLTVRDLLLQQPNATRVAAIAPLDLLVASAVAHPGHDDAGEVGGELLGTWEIDLLGEPVDLGTAQLYEGRYATASLGFGEAAAVVAGTVDAGAGGVPFRFEVVPTQALQGLDFAYTIRPEAPPDLALDIDLAWILSFVDWGSITDTDGDGFVTERDGDLANLVSFGLHSTAAYHVRVEPRR